MPRANKALVIERRTKIDEMVVRGYSVPEMAAELGITISSVYRLIRALAKRKEDSGQVDAYSRSILRELGRLYTKCLEDMETARQKNRHTFMYLDVAKGLLAQMARVSGAEAARKHLVVQAIQQVEKPNRTEVVHGDGPVQIIIEAAGETQYAPGWVSGHRVTTKQVEPPFDPNHGEGRVRVDVPSADEIQSANG